MAEQDPSAGDDLDGGERAGDEAVAACERQRLLQSDLHERRGAGFELGSAVHQQHAAGDLGGAVRDAHARPGCERVVVARGAEVGEPCVEAVRRLDGSRGCEEHAGPHLIGADAREVQRRAGSRRGGLDGCSVLLDAAHPHAAPDGKQLQLVVDAHRAAPKRARDDGAGAFDREGAVDRQARRSAVRVVDARRIAAGVRYRLLEFVQTRSVVCRHGDDRGRGVRRLRKAGADLVAHELRPLGVDEVGFGQRDDHRAHAEQLEHVQMLDRLGHDAVIGGDAQERNVDAGRARDHLPYEALVAGHVDDAHRPAVGKRKLREAELDGDAAPLLFREAVGIGAGERPDERRFSVVDMACGAQDQRGRGGAGVGHQEIPSK